MSRKVTFRLEAFAETDKIKVLRHEQHPTAVVPSNNRFMYLDLPTWREMGEPRWVTVTLEAE